jgi:hypothetical protein
LNLHANDSTFIKSCPLDFTQPEYKDFKRQDLTASCSIDGPTKIERDISKVPVACLLYDTAVFLLIIIS